MGLGFDMSNFNEDGSDDVYTFGISMPIRMVQYRDSFTWSKYSHHLFPNVLPKMRISGMNNVDDFFHQHMIEFLQTDIDGSVDFLLNAITCSPLFKTPFTTVVLDGFLLLMKGLSSMNRLLFPSLFFGLGVTNSAAKPDYVVPTGDDDSLYDSHSSGKLIVILINEALLSRKQQLCQKCKPRKSMKHCSQGSSTRVKNVNTGNHTLIS
jgi:hypothetical protein